MSDYIPVCLGSIQGELACSTPPPPQCAMCLYLPQQLFEFSLLSFEGKVWSFRVF